MRRPRGCALWHGWAWVATALALLGEPAASQPPRPEGMSRSDGPTSLTTTLPNGLRVLIKPTPATEVVAVDLLLDVSAVDEPAHQVGIRALIQRLLLRGTEAKSGEEVVRRVSEVGGFMGTELGLDYVEIYAVAPVDGFEPALEELAEVVRRPAFLPKEVENQKAALIRSLGRGSQDPFQETYAAFRQALYGSHPYGRRAEGDPQALASISREDVVAFHSRHYGPQNAVLSISGGVSESRAARALRRAFADWPAGPRHQRPEQAPGPLEASELVVRELPVGRLYMMLGFLAPGAGKAGYYALQVLDSLLSGGNTSRLPIVLRDAAGLAYQVSSFYPTLAGESHLAVYAVVDPESMSDGKEAILEVLRGICREMPPAAEMERAKRYLVGSYLLTHQRMKDQAYALGWYEVLGLGAGFEERYLRGIEAVTPQEVQEAATSLLRRFVLAVAVPGD